MNDFPSTCEIEAEINEHAKRPTFRPVSVFFQTNHIRNYPRKFTKTTSTCPHKNFESIACLKISILKIF